MLSDIWCPPCGMQRRADQPCSFNISRIRRRSEEHTSELQSQSNLVCRLLLEKKKCRRPCLGRSPRRRLARRPRSCVHASRESRLLVSRHLPPTRIRIPTPPSPLSAVGGRCEK